MYHPSISFLSSTISSSSTAIAVGHPSVYGSPCGYFVDEAS